MPPMPAPAQGSAQGSEPSGRGPARVLLVTSNGAGMGHLTRLLSVALAGGDRLDATMFSMSVALPVITEQGMPGEYCPGIDRDWMSGPRWHSYLRDRIIAIVHEIEADLVVFDGVAPYPGVGLARHRLPHTGFVWVRRAMWRPGVNAVQLSKSTLFDLIIEPGDLADAADRGPTAGRADAVRIGPISMLDVVTPLPRDEAAAALGLDPGRPTVLVTLGSGRLGDVAEPGRVVVETLLEHPEWQIAVTKTAIAQHHIPIVDRDRIVELHGVYPLVRYLPAFDAVVSAAGYNAVHEFIPAGLPTLLVPNPSTRTDDQVTRADHLAAEGLALSAHPDSARALAGGTRRLLQPGVGESLRAHIEALDPGRRSGGAAAAADLLGDLAVRFVHTPPPAVEQVRRGWRAFKELAKQGLGTRGTNVVRRVLGRQERVTGHTGRMPVRLVTDVRSLSSSQSTTTPLIFSDRIPSEVLRNGPPVEHLLTGASPEYVEERRRITETYYDVTNPR